MHFYDAGLVVPERRLSVYTILLASFHSTFLVYTHSVAAQSQLLMLALCREAAEWGTSKIHQCMRVFTCIPYLLCLWDSPSCSLNLSELDAKGCLNLLYVSVFCSQIFLWFSGWVENYWYIFAPHPLRNASEHFIDSLFNLSCPISHTSNQAVFLRSEMTLWRWSSSDIWHWYVYVQLIIIIIHGTW